MNARVRSLLSRLSPTQLAQQLLIARAPGGLGVDAWTRVTRETGAANLSVKDDADALAFLSQARAFEYELGAPFMLCGDPDGEPGAADHMPTPLALAASQSSVLAHEYGHLLARLALCRGVRLLFAPRLDVASASSRAVPVLYTMGDSHELVGVLGAAITMGIVGTGAQACARAYPGEGSASLDAESALRVTRTAMLIKNIDIVPFETAIGRELSGLLLSSAYYDALGSSPRHASGLLTSGLRGAVGYSGIVVTQCHSGEDAVHSLKSGVDMVLLPPGEGNANLTARAVLDAAARGTLTIASLMRAAGHVLSVKSNAGLLDGARVPSAPEPAELDALRVQVLSKSLTRLGPIRQPAGERTLLILPGRVHRRVSVAGFQTLYINLSPGAALIEAAERMAGECSTAIVAVENAQDHPGQLELARRVAAACEDTRIVCCGVPDDALHFVGSTVYLTYGEPAARHPTLLSALRSGAQPMGVCPLKAIQSQF